MVLCYHQVPGPEIPVLKLYRRVHIWWTGRNNNPTVGALGRGLRAHTSSSMVANTGVVFSASVTAQIEVTVGFSFTFGSFPEVTVLRNPASGSPATGGNVVAGVRSDLNPPSACRLSDSRIREPRRGGHANQG